MLVSMQLAVPIRAACHPWTACWRGTVHALTPSARQAGSHLARSNSLRPNETPGEAAERRARESERVEERVTYVVNQAEFAEELAKAGERLVVLEVHSERLCQSGLEEAELQWKDDQARVAQSCVELKHVFQRTARDCPDVVFLALEADSEEGHDLCDALGVEVLPTLQFYRAGQQLWEHRGYAAAGQDLGEGVLYFGDTAANNEKASTFVRDLHSKADLEDFVSTQDDKVLCVVDVCLTSAAPCVHIFPAVLALARSFGGYAAFARVLGDENAELKALMGELGVLEVPTFLFYRAGQPVGRHVGSSRGDLIGKILEQQAAAGVAAPAPASGGVRRKRAMPKAPRKSKW